MWAAHTHRDQKQPHQPRYNPAQLSGQALSMNLTSPATRNHALIHAMHSLQALLEKQTAVIMDQTKRNNHISTHNTASPSFNTAGQGGISSLVVHTAWDTVHKSKQSETTRCSALVNSLLATQETQGTARRRE